MPSNGDVNALSLPEVLEAARIELGEDKQQMEVSYCQLTLGNFKLSAHTVKFQIFISYYEKIDKIIPHYKK